MPNPIRLMPISYYNPSQEIRLSAYADTVVYESEGSRKVLYAIRFGGYPEMVRGLTDAIHARASIDVRIGDETISLAGRIKQYMRQLNHDGIYAEATLLATDDDTGTRSDTKEDDAQVPADLPPRKCTIFCPADDRDRLFDEIDRKTSVPLIPTFRDYVLDELERRDILKKLTVHSVSEKIDAWILKCQSNDANVISVVEDGLKSGIISIPGALSDPNGFDGVTNVTGYLNTFGVTVAERIRNQFRPLFDPATESLSQEILSINDYISTHAGYPLYAAQLAVAEAAKRQMQRHKCALIVAECGSGKTKIGATAMSALQASRCNGAKKTFNAVLCPSHITGKWAREIAETLPNTVGVVVRSNAELDKLYSLFKKGSKSVYAIISKEKARDGYMRRPAVVWNERLQAFLCPDCLMPIETPISQDGSKYMVGVSQHFFRSETGKNHRCEHCSTPLWTTVNPAEESDWVKIGGYGWVYKHKVSEHFDQTNDETVLERLHEIAKNPTPHHPTVGACRRYPVSSYIKRRYKGLLDGLIVDELHEYNNDSGQGDAMAEMFSAAKKVIGMTATLINGYSSGIFHLLYRVASKSMLQDGKTHDSPNEFNTEYGVVENTYEEADSVYASNRRAQRTKKRSRQLPGVSPLVYSRFLLEQTAFLSLSDMGKHLPDYEEIPVPLDMEDGVATEYSRIESVLTGVLRTDRAAAQKILSSYLNLLTAYPDQPYNQPSIVHPIHGHNLVSPKDMGSFDSIGAKERAVLDIVRSKVENGERVLVYTSWTRTDSQQKLLNLLTEAGYRAEIMSDKVRPLAREEWVQKRLASGMQVLITNPSLVETGLDLNAFTTLVFYSMGYKLFTLRQASRRSWRINQTAPRVEVYMLYYRDTMQHKALKLMASKLAVAGIIEGNFTEEGLAAMSDVQDMTSLMAKELMLGIRDNVEDIAATFKKMAIVNPEWQIVETAEPMPIPEPEPAHIAPPLPQPRVVVPIAELLEQAQRSKRTKKVFIVEGQLSLFGDAA